jgi:hypothetical protein
MNTSLDLLYVFSEARGQSKHKKLRCGSYTIDELMSTLFTLNRFENSAFAAHFH